MNYSLGNMLSNGGALNPDGLALDLQFAADKTLTARKGPTPTFSRASAATEIGSDGLIRYAPENLLTRSNDFANADWTAERATVSSNTTVAPDGSTTADKLTEDSTASNSHRITRQLNLSAIPYTFSVFAKASERSWIRMTLFDGATSRQVWFDVSAGVIGTQSGAIGQIISFGNGWWRCSITATGLAFISSQTNIALATADNVTVYTGDGTSGLFLWGAQLERYSSARTYIPTTTAAVYGARFDHDPVTLASRGLLIEESRTNLLLRSEEFQANWTTYQATVSANSATSPSGSVSADSLVENLVTDAHSIFQSVSVAASTTYTLSIYAKAGNRNWITLFEGTSGSNRRTFFNLSTGTVGTKDAAHTALIQQLPNGWWRCSITFTSGASGSRVFATELASADNVASYTGNGTGNVFLWGAQLEAGSFPTSYIPTTTASVVRSADVCSITGSDFSGFYNQSEGAMFANAFTPASGDRTVLAVDDNTANEMIRLRTETANPFFKVTDGGSEVVAIDAGTVTANTAFKLIGAYKVNDFASSINGGSAVTDTTGTIPTVDRMRIGAGQGGNTMCGCISAIRYFKKRLPDAKLQSLTA